MIRLPRGSRHTTRRRTHHRAHTPRPLRADGLGPLDQADHGVTLYLRALKIWGGPPIFIVPELPTIPGRPPMLAGTDRETHWIFLREDLVDRALTGNRQAIGKVRAVLAHELAHVVYPHMDEDEVEGEAARALIPAREALALHGQVMDVEEMRETAQRLLVDPALLATRLRDIAS